MGDGFSFDGGYGVAWAVLEKKSLWLLVGG